MVIHNISRVFVMSRDLCWQTHFGDKKGRWVMAKTVLYKGKKYRSAWSLHLKTGLNKNHVYDAIKGKGPLAKEISFVRGVRLTYKNGNIMMKDGLAPTRVFSHEGMAKTTREVAEAEKISVSCVIKRQERGVIKNASIEECLERWPNANVTGHVAPEKPEVSLVEEEVVEAAPKFDFNTVFQAFVWPGDGAVTVRGGSFSMTRSKIDEIPQEILNECKWVN